MTKEMMGGSADVSCAERKNSLYVTGSRIVTRGMYPMQRGIRYRV